MSKKKAYSFAKHATLGLGLVAFGVVLGAVWQRPTPSRERQLALTATQAAVVQHPLTIAAQRARTYVGGDFRVVTDLGIGEGYRLSRITYSSDGLVVQGLMATPDRPRPPTGYPVVILAHGFVTPDAYRSNGPEYKETIRAFARAGYLVIKPDFRGYGASWGTPCSAYYDTCDTADILNLATSLAAYSVADAGTIGLWGHSMGGRVVFNAVAVAPDRFKAAVVVAAGVGDVADVFESWRPPSDSNIVTAAVQRDRLVQLFGTPRANPVFWASVSPLSYAQDMTVPLQLHTGTADTVVPSRFTDQAGAALTTAGAIPEVFHYPGTGHVFSGAALGLLHERSLQLYARYLHR